ncbi:MAG: arginine--tRNA ligase [Candidatus Thermoplasmatota archaeon]|nr:arginine--tRNA ligase [Candidatus Thermoplasmatota archaeon]
MAEDAFQRFKDEISEAVSKTLKELNVETEIVIDKAPQGMGDLAFPCFPLAKKLKKSPDAIAKDIASRIKPKDLIERIEAKGGYVSFTVSFDKLAQKAIDEALSKKERFGTPDKKKGARVLLEHTSVNPTGPIHVGRARNPIIGDTLARILRQAGYDVTTEFYVNDVGRQAVVMTWGVKHLKLDAEPERDKDDYRYVLHYQQANKLLEEDPGVLKEIDSMLYKLEHGDPATVKLAREACEKVLSAIMESLKRLNVKVDRFTWESKFVADRSVEKVVAKLKTSEYCREQDGAYYLELESFGISGRETKWIFTRADGTSVYTTRDLAYHLDKFARSDIAINILGEDHKLAMQELSAALSIMGLEKKPEIVYYAFVSLPEGKMSTRKGRVVNLDDLIDEAIELAYDEVKKRRTDLSEERMREIARIVGVGALRYNIARIQAEKQIVFKWEDALNFEGSSAPFIQYAHARACSILSKAEGWGREFDAKHLTSSQEMDLTKLVASFPSVIADCAEDRKTHVLAGYAQDLAAQFNQFYRFVPVLRSEGAVRDARLALVEASMWTLRNSLNCLGLDAPEEM